METSPAPRLGTCILFLRRTCPAHVQGGWESQAADELPWRFRPSFACRCRWSCGCVRAAGWSGVTLAALRGSCPPVSPSDSPRPGPLHAMPTPCPRHAVSPTPAPHVSHWLSFCGLSGFCLSPLVSSQTGPLPEPEPCLLRTCPARPGVASAHLPAGPAVWVEDACSRSHWWSARPWSLPSACSRAEPADSSPSRPFGVDSPALLRGAEGRWGRDPRTLRLRFREVQQAVTLCVAHGCVVTTKHRSVPEWSVTGCFLFRSISFPER